MKVILILAAIAVAAFLFWRSRQREETSTRREVRNFPPAVGDERQILLRPGPGACSVARQQAGRSFGSSEMPRLPLPGCRASSCQCRFDVITGRRKGERREHSDRRESVRFDDKGGERRRKDRRRSGADPWGIDPDSGRDSRD